VEAISPDTHILGLLWGIEGWRRHPVERPSLVTVGLPDILLRELDMAVPDLDTSDQMVQAKDVVDL
jgi:hypothetical protein